MILVIRCAYDILLPLLFYYDRANLERGRLWLTTQVTSKLWCRRFPIVVFGVFEASKCFPTIDFLDERCPICLLSFTSSARGQIKDAMKLSRREVMRFYYSSLSEAWRMNAPDAGILQLCWMGSGHFPFLLLLFSLT